MADLLLDDAYDRFVVMYDIALLISEDVKSESAIISAVHLSSGAVRQMILFMLDQGYIRTAKSDSEFRITTRIELAARVLGHEEISLLAHVYLFFSPVF